MSTPEDAGAIIAQLRLDLSEAQRDALEAQKKMDALAAKFKKQGEDAGKGFAGGMKKGFDSTSAAAGKMGKKIGQALAPALIALQAGIKIVQSLAAGFMNAMMANEKLSKAVSDLKSSMGQSFANAVKPVSNFFANLIQKTADSIKGSKALREELKRLRGEIPEDVPRALADELESMTASVAQAKKDMEKLDNPDFFTKISDAFNPAEAKQARAEWIENHKSDLQKLETQYENLKQKTGNATVEVIKQWEDINTEMVNTKKTIEQSLNSLSIDSVEAARREAGALEACIEKTNELIASQKGLASPIITNTLQEQIARRNELLKLTEKETKGKTENTKKEVTFEERRLELMERYAKGLRDAESQRETNAMRGMKSEEAELLKKQQIEHLSAQIYADMLSIKGEYNATNQETEKWEGNLKEIEKTLGTIDKGNRNWLAEKLGLTEKGFSDMMTMGQATISTFDTISNMALDISRKHAEEQIAIIESGLEELLENIEKARQAELEAQGFIEASSEEEIQKQIDRAKEAGDEVLQYHLERRKQELAINKKYDDLTKAEEERAAKEKATVEFELAKQEYAQQLIQAANAAAMAIMQALASAPPPFNFALAALSGAATAVQIGLLASNPPAMPQFADGGIVPGRKSDGDVQHVIATAGEVILNEAQQDTVARKLESRNGYTQLTVIMQMDGREVAQTVADVYGSGKILIPLRGIAR
jgi:hypothetical protein